MHNLGQILRDMRLTGGVFLDAEFKAPWRITSQVDAKVCSQFMKVPRKLIAYHYILQGNLVVEVDGMPPLEGTKGQLLVLPQNDPHFLGSATDVIPVDVGKLITAIPGSDLPQIRYGGAGASTRLLCGFLGSDNVCDPLLSNLPSAILLTLDPGSGGGWVEGSMRYALNELMLEGSAAATSLARLAELLLGEAIRGYVNQLPADANGWLSGLRDPIVGHALALMHGDLARSWTLDDLARESGTSRTTLSLRFSRLLGQAPIEYLRHLRLERTAELLVQSDRPISGMAFDVGYGSEAALSRSFRRTYGMSPGAYRSIQRQNT